jgi:hypothetical protein
MTPRRRETAQAPARRPRLRQPCPVATLAAAVERQGAVVRFLSYTGLRWDEMARYECGISTCCGDG